MIGQDTVETVVKGTTEVTKLMAGKRPPCTYMKTTHVDMTGVRNIVLKGVVLRCLFGLQCSVPRYTR